MQHQQSGFVNDYISHLPDSVLTSILSYLDIKDAARTSVLSHRWKYVWLSLPHIQLDQSLGFDLATLSVSEPRLFPYLNSDKFDHKRWLSSFTHIFVSRSRCYSQHPILTCSVRFDQFSEYEFLFASFFLFLCINGIEELEIWNDNMVDFNLPIHVYFCSTFQSLTFKSCVVDLPANFSSWKALKEIGLFSVFVSDSDLDLIMSSCKALEFLRLEDCKGFGKIAVRAQKLTTLLIYHDDKISLSLDDVPSIIELCVPLWWFFGTRHAEKDAYNLFKLLMNIPSVEQLNLTYQEDSVQDTTKLAKEKIRLPQCLPSGHLLHNLQELSLSICFYDADLVATLSCLLRSSPNLQALTLIDEPIGIMSEAYSPYWERHEVADCMKHQLSIVELLYINLNCVSVVKFIKFILMNARVLQTMLVSYCDISVPPSLVEHELRSLQWASNHATLEFGPHNEA